MKSILIGCVLTTIALFGTSNCAEARSHEKHHRNHFRSSTYVSGYSSYGAPIYVERYVVGYDCYGQPIWGERILRPVHRHDHRSSYGVLYSPPGYYRSRSGARVTIGASFGR